MAQGKPQFRKVKMDEALEAFRRDPRSYTDFRQKFDAANDDEERFQMLVDFATEEVDLRKLSASPTEPQAELLPITTVTVTTVFVPTSAY